MSTKRAVFAILRTRHGRADEERRQTCNSSSNTKQKRGRRLRQAALLCKERNVHNLTVWFRFVNRAKHALTICAKIYNQYLNILYSLEFFFRISVNWSPSWCHSIRFTLGRSASKSKKPPFRSPMKVCTSMGTQLGWLFT